MTANERRELLNLIREWTALRKCDHEAARLKMSQEDWTTEKVKAAEEEEKAKAVAAKASEKGKYAALRNEIRRRGWEPVHELQDAFRLQGAINGPGEKGSTRTRGASA